LPDPPGVPALAGTFAHAVLERLFQAPAAGRTVERAKELAREVWPSTEHDPHYQALGLDEAGARHFRCAGGRPSRLCTSKTRPPSTYGPGTRSTPPSVGSVRGIVDCLDQAPDGSLEVTDYKSGRAPSVPSATAGFPGAAYAPGARFHG
jgi:putative RecB family exonuclease